MGSPFSRPPPQAYYRAAGPAYAAAPRAYLLPSETLLTCPGGPINCFCRLAHARPRFVYLDPVALGTGRGRRYLDPLQYVERLVVGQQSMYPFGGAGDMFGGGGAEMPGAGVGYPFGAGGGGGGAAAYGFGFGGAGFAGGGAFGGGGGGGGAAFGGGGGAAAFAGGGMPFPFGGFGGLGWKDPRDWTTRDFDTLSEVLEELMARQRGRRGGRGHHYGGGGGGGDYYGYDRDRDGGGGGGRGRREVRDLIALLQQLDTSRRLNGVETTVYGTEAEAREAAFRKRLYSMFGGGEGNERQDRNERAGGLGFGGRGGGGGGTGARFAQQQRDHERREREQRNLDREVDEIRKHLERLRDQGDRGRGGGWIEEWPFG